MQAGKITNLLCGKDEVLPAVLLGGVLMGPGQEFRHLSGGELCLAHVPEIPRQVNCLP